MRMGPRSLVSAVAVILAASSLSVCGKKSPTDNTPATPPPTTAPPATQPTPVPTSCDRLGYVGPSNSCSSQGPSFLPQLERAMDRLVAEHPEIFKLSESSGSGQYRVVSTGRYYVGLMKNLESQGLCAGFDGEELAIKDSNAFNDQYHVMTSAFFMRRGQGSYRTTCTPAVFPTPPPPFPPNNGCPLPGSREVTCSREGHHFLADVERAVVKVTTERPELFDLNETAPGTSNWYAIRDSDKFFDAMVQAMISFGYCARYDGEELVVKKTNEFNEQFDIFAGEGYVRRGEGSYRATCYPAAF